MSTTLSTAIPITVGNPPTPTISSPATGRLFRAGDVITFSGARPTPRTGTLPASAFSWTILFHHDTPRPSGGRAVHEHEDRDACRSRPADTTSRAATNYEIVLTVTDSTGLTASTSVTIFPDKVNLTFNTVPERARPRDRRHQQADAVRARRSESASSTPSLRRTSRAEGRRTPSSRGRTEVRRATAIVVPTVDQSYVATFQATSAAVRPRRGVLVR